MWPEYLKPFEGRLLRRKRDGNEFWLTKPCGKQNRDGDEMGFLTMAGLKPGRNYWSSHVDILDQLEIVA